MSSLFLILILPVFLILSGFFSLVETAVLSSNRYRVQHLASKRNRNAQKLAAWLDAPQKLLATILLGNNFANIAAATIAAAIVTNSFQGQHLDLYLALETIALTLIVLLFCELGPKAFATRMPERISLNLVIPIEFWMRLVSPVSRFAVWFAGLFYRSVRENQNELVNSISEVELKSIINSYSNERREMLERVLEFSERQVRDVMVSRMETVSIPISVSFDEVLRIIETTRFTRFPVYHGSMDNVLGILHGKDLMPYMQQQKTFHASNLLRKPIFIPDTARLNIAIRTLQTAQTHMGIVVDEHGGVGGIVTLEDLIEQIVGEIQDEHDLEVDEIISQANGSYLIDGSISVRELNEKLHLNVPEEGPYVTLAGFILTKTGRLPTEGDEIRFEGSTYRVDQMVGRRIIRVQLNQVQSSESIQEETLNLKGKA